MSHVISAEAPLQHPVPIKLHSTLMGYIDRLTPSQVLLLKTASAICMGQGSGSTIFDYHSIVDCYPVVEYQDLVDSDLQHLSEVGIINTIGDVLKYSLHIMTVRCRYDHIVFKRETVHNYIKCKR